MNRIWLGLILISIIVGVANHQVIEINQVIAGIGKDTLTLVLPLIAMSSFFNGWLHVAKKAGIMDGLTTLLLPVLHLIFPELKNQKEALGYIASNMVMNIFGLGSAATASGLKAMQCLQACNPQKDTASRSMITFIVLNTAGITVFASTVISLRSLYHAANPADFLPFAFWSSLIACILALAIDAIVHHLQ